MAGRARHRCWAGGATLLPFLGVWLGHTAEYVRVHGADGLRTEAGGSVHGYMIAAGILLSLLAAAVGLRGLQAWWTLGRRLRAARQAVESAWRSTPLPTTPIEPRGASPASAGYVSLLSWLGPVQVLLYVIQENLEAWRAGAAVPGAAVVSGVHWAAPAVHLAVAAGLAAAVVLAQRVLGRRRRAVVACQRLARVLVTALLRSEPALRPRVLWIRSPRDRWASQLLRRPPPALPAS
jgi:hypothetical protein